MPGSPWQLYAISSGANAFLNICVARVELRTVRLRLNVYPWEQFE